MRKARNKMGGFTIVEVLAAGLILVTSAIAIGTAVSGSLRSLTDARDCQRAAQLLDSALTWVDLAGPERLAREGPSEGRFQPPDEKYSWQAEIRPCLLGHLYEVTVRVSWNSPVGDRKVEAQTLLNDAPDSRGQAPGGTGP